MVNNSLQDKKKKKIALVLQGGGQKGIFTAAVLDTFIKNQFDPFSLYYGTSAGALNLCAYLSRQTGYGRQMIEEETTDEQFFTLSRYLGERKGMDLAWLIAQSSTNGTRPFNHERAREVLRHKEAFACSTHATTLKPHYFPLYDAHFNKVLQATSAIPLVAEPIEINGEFWLDGGVSASIPVYEPYSKGADIIVVVLTDPISSFKVHEKEYQSKLDDMIMQLSHYLKEIKFEKPDQDNRFQILLQLERLKRKVEDQLDHLKINLRSFQKDQWMLKLLQYSPDALKDNLYKVPLLSEVLMDENGRQGDKLDMFVKHMKTSNEIERFLVAPPSDLQIIIIEPEQKLKTKPLMSSLRHLSQDYAHGEERATHFLGLYREMLEMNSVQPYYI